MLSENRIEFTKENIDIYLKDLAKAYRKAVGKDMHAEIILIGGASVLINYGFRDMTTDIDAMIHAASAMKDAINYVGNHYDLPVGWLNEDFKHTASFSPRLTLFSKYYRTYSNVLEVRTISEEYLVAMKLRSGRQYKNDFSDILGILAAHEKGEVPITMVQLQKAVCNLYGSWNVLPDASRTFITTVMQRGNYQELYAKVVQGEQETKDLLQGFEAAYPGVTRESNVDDIAENLQKKVNRASFLAELRGKMSKQAPEIREPDDELEL